MKRYKYSRQLYSCKCNAGNCMRFDAYLCQPKIKDKGAPAPLIYMPVGYTDGDRRQRPVIIRGDGRINERKE